ncbi:MAG: spore coat U domain-containing protein [Steroidobacteraceae bacterium]|nr:spore coat U domain-containing protein [Steroidobacteraceae bacterium]
MHFIRRSPLAAALLALCGSAQAASPASTTFGVSASVAANCLVTAGNIAFGSYDGSAARTASQDLKVRCTNGLPYTVKLSSGLGGTFAQRLLTDGGNTLQYNLFTEAGNTNIWGDGTASTVTVPGTGAGMSATKEQTHTIFGSLPNSAANQDAPVGNYADTITVTVEY